MKKPATTPLAKNVRIELDPETLVRLLRNRQVAAIEMRCLDQESREALRMLCLDSIRE